MLNNKTNKMNLKVFGTKLYFRLWLAVVLTIAVLTILLGWVTRATYEPLPREITVRNNEGTIIAHGFVRGKPVSELDNKLADEANQQRSKPQPSAQQSQTSEPQIQHGQYGSGSEFLVQTIDGAWLHIYLSHKTPRPFWNRHKYGWLWLLILVGVSVSFATYPVMRRLTRRLENLKNSVAIWGSGNLSARVQVQGRDEIAYLAEQFNHSADQIEVLVNSHKSLLANASHELRTPLARIRMALELMGNTAPEHLKREMTQNIIELDQLVDEILTASRLDAPQSKIGERGELEVVDLTGLASEECSHKNAELDLGTTPQSYLTLGNPQLLRRVIRNLLDNAEKHASQNILHHSNSKSDADSSSSSSSNSGLITVQLNFETVHPNSSIRIAVLDRGPGVEKDEQSKIFEPFYRAKSIAQTKTNADPGTGYPTQSSGAGLGLSLVKTICEWHGGSVHYEDREGGGSAFIVLLPNLDQKS